MGTESKVDTVPPRALARTTVVVLTRPPELPPEELGHGADRGTDSIFNAGDIYLR